MGGVGTGRSATSAGFTSFFVLLSAALAVSTPVTTLRPGGYNGLDEKVCPEFVELAEGNYAAKRYSDQRHIAKTRMLRSGRTTPCNFADVCHNHQHNTEHLPRFPTPDSDL